MRGDGGKRYQGEIKTEKRGKGGQIFKRVSAKLMPSFFAFLKRFNNFFALKKKLY